MALRIARTWLTVCASFLSVAWSQHAAAESAPLQCSDFDLIQIAPGTDGLTLPANAPALVAYDDPGWTAEFELVGPDGQPVAFTVESDSYAHSYGARLLRFDSELKEGKGYELRWTQTCTYPSPAPKEIKGVRVFHVGPAVAWPSPPGTIETQLGSSTKLAFSVKFSPELQAFLPLASIRFFSTHNGGLASQDYGAFTLPIAEGTWDLSCTSPGPTQDTFSLNAHVAGFVADPASVQATFQYDCPNVPAPDAGTSNPDAGSVGAQDAAILQDGPDGIWNAAPGASGRQGCSTRGRRGEGDTGLFAVGLAALCAARLRRRPRVAVRS